MTSENNPEQQEPSKATTPRIAKATRNEVLTDVVTELARREEEMYKDTYGSRDYCDGVREEVRRMQTWLAEMMK